MHRADRLAVTVCAECIHGMHQVCIRQGCYCPCQLPEDTQERECIHGYVRSMCEQCEQEEQ
jgi:hypothetical protein